MLFVHIQKYFFVLWMHAVNQSTSSWFKTNEFRGCTKLQRLLWVTFFVFRIYHSGTSFPWLFRLSNLFNVNLPSKWHTYSCHSIIFLLRFAPAFSRSWMLSRFYELIFFPVVRLLFYLVVLSSPNKLIYWYKRIHSLTYPWTFNSLCIIRVH